MIDSGIEIPYDAPEAVREALNGLGRTEDLGISHDNRRLAILCSDRNAIAVVDVDIVTAAGRPQVTVSAFAEYTSPCLAYPHGVDFLDENTMIVANRRGTVNALRLPTARGSGLTLIDVPLPHGFEFLGAPGSVTVARAGEGMLEVLIGNSAGNTITSHTLRANPLDVTSSQVLLHRWLDVPDGIALSADGRWIAVSNHEAHVVMLYARSSSLHEESDPNCILRGASYPHGLHFSSDGRHLFVADAGAPYVHVYACDGHGWQGVQLPAVSLRVMADETFQRGRSTGEGGPKGIDMDREGRVIAITSARQPLAFLDISEILERSDASRPDHALRVRRELEIGEESRAVRARNAALLASASFRLTKPLRFLNAKRARRSRNRR